MSAGNLQIYARPFLQLMFNIKSTLVLGLCHHHGVTLGEVLSAKLSAMASVVHVISHLTFSYQFIRQRKQSLRSQSVTAVSSLCCINLFLLTTTHGLQQGGLFSILSRYLISRCHTRDEAFCLTVQIKCNPFYQETAGKEIIIFGGKKKICAFNICVPLL